MSRFTEVLTVSPLSDGRTWVTRKDFGYDIGEEGSGNTIDVPIGFMTDFASVPRFLWMIIPRWGKYGNAAIIHDYLYWEQKRSRKEADDVFLEAMGVLGVSPSTKWVMHKAVRVFGGFAWRGNTGRRKKGLSRVAVTMPEKSTDVPEMLQAKTR
ncbi:MAG TPA: DUF1353 domain-containing protein [Dehalococcoidia bacterium]|nr:DUF1353 domain-containing protein [Dehalococcoidia bacterium]